MPLIQTAGGVRWKKKNLIANPYLRIVIVFSAVIYLALALSSVDVNWARVQEGMGRGLAFLGSFLRPDFFSRWDEIFDGILESLTMTAVATAAGIILSVPVGVGAAGNIAPFPVYFLCRSVIAASRTFPEVIIAIFFVAMFGFGALAGMLTLMFATIGFMAKLLAEDIEDADPVQTEAIRSTGAGFFQILTWSIQPQVMPRLIGLSVYRLDINFRESAVIGIVGAGGIGATLNTSIDRYEYDTTAAILIVIIMIVMLAEYMSGIIRKRLQ
ncbi:phosphonate ABC transporter, permease protein PhnE [Geovibrio thiophilus]|uniref:Phosphonate ABC transporter, permease protein PhnE n=1 Tax=Geovibrio thiophilus TaxID=139438 RepID=A0A410K093_9BACT|nr:phosphonate ABC transporter, permease protein PhnE [Geovibrio thiophilus]QAR33830.1 phosphonate ABC transporter, permease protein PhnE [Geovibrio thiophilus]